jgi:hypothetical protein
VLLYCASDFSILSSLFHSVAVCDFLFQVAPDDDFIVGYMRDQAHEQLLPCLLTQKLVLPEMYGRCCDFVVVLILFCLFFKDYFLIST